MYRRTEFRNAGVVAFAGLALMLAGTAQSHAEEGIFESLSTVAEDALAQERGRNVVVDENGIEIDAAGGALAINIGFQQVDNTINGDAHGGSITLMPNALDGQRFVINAFNAGNNVTMLNQLSIAVDMTTPAP